MAYVIGWVNFLGCKIDLSQRPLIPRPETEYWTEKAIQGMRSEKKPVDCLDAFAGSGCIGISVLKHVPKARVRLADNDPACLKQIRRNLKLNRVRPNRYKIKHSNILQNVGASFDYILANPPYIPANRKGRLAESVLNFEPHSALFAGSDGLRFLRPLIREARGHLHPAGELWLEFDSSQKNAVLALARRYGYAETVIHRDQFGRNRYAILKA